VSRRASAATAVVGAFRDPDPGEPAGAYTATITWGDGHTAAGTVLPDPLVSGGFLVTGTNLYAEEGTDNIRVAVQSAGGAQATIASTADVADAPVTAAGASATATEGAAFTGVVATFTDANPGATAGDFSATIAWGDGQTAPGAIVPDPTRTGTFDVTGTNTYAEEGTYAPDVVLRDAGGATAEVKGSVVVADAALQSAGTPGTADARTPFTAPVATLDDANPSASAADFTVAIAWGDGHTSPGTVAAVPGKPGRFTIQGASTYDQPGSFDVTVTVMDQGGVQSTAHTTWQVAGAPDAPLTAAGTAFHASRGNAAIVAVASFTDADPDGQLSDYTAQVTWGDQHVSPGRIIPDPSNAGRFLVLSGNVYAADGTYPVQVTITDQGGATAVAQSTAIVGSGVGRGPSVAPPPRAAAGPSPSPGANPTGLCPLP
jgi:hypothetical protein